MASPVDVAYQRNDGTDITYAGSNPPLQAQLLALMPDIPDLGTSSDITLAEIRLDGLGSERNELGLFDEWISELKAKSGNYPRSEEIRKFTIAQANSIKHLSWDDLAKLSNEKNPTTQGNGKIETSYAHFPNRFFTAAMLTRLQSERDGFITCARNKLTSASAHFNNPETSYWKDEQQRGWAWALREIAQLAYLEREGILTGTGTYYRDILTANKTHIDLVIARAECFDHAILPEIWRTMYGGTDRTADNMWRRSGWQQSMIGMTIAYINKLGFDWMNVAEFHWQHWKLRRDNWGWESVDYDYAVFDRVIPIYDALSPAQQASFDWFGSLNRSEYITDGNGSTDRDAALTAASWDSALIVDTVLNSGTQNEQQMTFPSRLDMIMSCMAMYRNIGIFGAGTFLDELKIQRQARIDRGGSGDYQAYRHSYDWRE